MIRQFVWSLNWRFFKKINRSENRGVGQFLPLNSNNAVLYRSSKYFETSKYHTKQRYLNLTVKTDPPLENDLKFSYTISSQ